MMHLTTIQCNGPTFDINWIIVLTVNARSALAPTVAYMRLPTPALYKTPSNFHCTFLNFSLICFNNLKFASNEIRLVCILPCWNAWAPSWCSFFGSWWWYGLLRNIATLQDCSFWFLSWASIWTTSMGLHTKYCMSPWETSWFSYLDKSLNLEELHCWREIPLNSLC